MLYFKRLVMLVAVCVVSIATLFVMPSPTDQEQAIYVRRGSLWSASEQLEQQGTIRHRLIFFPVAKCFNSVKKLQAGEYLLPPRASMWDILRLMQSGRHIKRAITIPEGYTTEQVLTLVEKDPYLSGQVDKDSYKEGMFLPETYFFVRDDTRQAVLKRMADAMKQALADAWNERSPDLPLKNETELLILASIVEEEAKLDSERSRIASVFINRLKKNMRLEADPTTIYAITGGQYVLKRPLTKADLKLNSPFNTYVYRGLPPGPITNPGIGSIKAVAQPDSGHDLYFVVSGCEGAHNFSRSMAEHISHVRSYRKLKCNG
jgi:UPF0755 protein